jgi:hypothetical protein
MSQCLQMKCVESTRGLKLFDKKRVRDEEELIIIWSPFDKEEKIK